MEMVTSGISCWNPDDTDGMEFLIFLDVDDDGDGYGTK
jgi:hypothetical protein